MDVFNRCENTNDVLLAIPGWANVHPLLKVIPVKWEHSIPYGFSIPRNQRLRYGDFWMRRRPSEKNCTDQL